MCNMKGENKMEENIINRIDRMERSIQKIMDKLGIESNETELDPIENYCSKIKFTYDEFIDMLKNGNCGKDCYGMHIEDDWVIAGGEEGLYYDLISTPAKDLFIPSFILDLHRKEEDHGYTEDNYEAINSEDEITRTIALMKADYASSIARFYLNAIMMKRKSENKIIEYSVKRRFNYAIVESGGEESECIRYVGSACDRFWVPSFSQVFLSSGFEINSNKSIFTNDIYDIYNLYESGNPFKINLSLDRPIITTSSGFVDIKNYVANIGQLTLIDRKKTLKTATYGERYPIGIRVSPYANSNGRLTVIPDGCSKDDICKEILL